MIQFRNMCESCCGIFFVPVGQFKRSKMGGDGMSKETWLEKRLESLINSLEAMGLDDYLAKRNNTRRMLWNSFLVGIARGLGTAVGFTILGAILFIILQKIAMANLPIIGDFIAQIVQFVERSAK